MRKFYRDIKGIDMGSKNYNNTGILSSSDSNSSNIENMHGSQFRGTKMALPYGISSRPPSGTKVQVMSNGSDDVIVGVHDADRKKCGVGELVLYSSGGCKVCLSNDGTLTMSNGSCGISLGKDGKIDITCVELSVNGQVIP